LLALYEELTRDLYELHMGSVRKLHMSVNCVLALCYLCLERQEADIYCLYMSNKSFEKNWYKR
jgi:hypothetical protein